MVKKNAQYNVYNGTDFDEIHFKTNASLVEGLDKNAVGLNNVDNIKQASKTEFDAHLAESASKHITESGSNENGRYIKFDDGTAIAYLNKEMTASGTTIDYGIIPYPITFTTTPIVTTSKSETDSQTWSGIIHVGNISPSGARVIINNVNNGVTYKCNLIVIGRWK